MARTTPSPKKTRGAGYIPTEVTINPSTPITPHGGLLKNPILGTQPGKCYLRTRHNHHGNKYQVWTLKPSRPFLIMGDSNVDRLPHIEGSRVQVDSYPGALLAHAIHILKHKTPTSADTQTLILSFGINNKDQGNPTLIRKQLSRLLGAAMDTFPNATIHIPIINFSQDLSNRHKVNLNGLNKLIKDTGRSIPPLQKTNFATGRDWLHWTPDTGKAMAHHWLKYLN